MKTLVNTLFTWQFGVGTALAGGAGAAGLVAGGHTTLLLWTLLGPGVLIAVLLFAARGRSDGWSGLGFVVGVGFSVLGAPWLVGAVAVAVELLALGSPEHRNLARAAMVLASVAAGLLLWVGEGLRRARSRRAHGATARRCE